MISNEMSKIISSIPSEAGNLQISCQDDYIRAVDLVSKIKQLRKTIDESFDPIIQRAHQAHKEALVQKRRHTDPLDQAERELKRRMGEYVQECERRRLEEQRRIALEIRRAAEERALQTAQELEAAGDPEVANSVLEDAVNAPVQTPVVESDVPKCDGITYRKTYRYEIVDVAAINRQFLAPDTVKIGQTVRALGRDAESVVGGISVVEELVASVRA